MEETIEKLKKLRKEIRKQSLDGFIHPVGDEYMSEYPPQSNRRVEWLCGFSGSAGTVAVLAARAALFTDGRYTLQAAKEVDGRLFAQHNMASLSPEAWLAGQAAKGARIGYDPKLHSCDAIKRMQGVLAAKNIDLVPTSNLIDAVWNTRPALPATPLFIHELRYAGESARAKRKHIAARLVKAGADAAVIATPDAVCWLLNVRGRDVENTPLVLAPALIDGRGRVQLFVSPSRCNAKVRAHLGKEVTLYAPAVLEKQLKTLGRKKSRVLCDPASAPVWYAQVLEKAGAAIVEAQDPCALPKAVKNKVELKGIRAAHVRDGAAVARLLCWLEMSASRGRVTELEVGEKLHGFRAANAMFVEPSFNSITGSGANGAIVHYRASAKSNRALRKGELFLLDSGGQYPDGTTDITRTVAIGRPTAEHKDRFTRVLKGHIALATARFPEGTSGSQLDALARQYLWQEGLDYDHGTGHGVGCFLGVHEGPQRISKRGGDAPLKAGMIVSNEPGYYKAGAYGIRIENLVVVTALSKDKGGKGWLGFETITCAPLDTRLVEPSMLTASEKAWLNDYHAWVLRMLSPLLNPAERTWLRRRTAPI